MKHLKQYMQYLQSQGYAQGTLFKKQRDIQQFGEWILIEDERLVEKADLQMYQQQLQTHQIGQCFMNAKIRNIKRYFNYLVRYGYLLIDPARGIEISKENRYYPRDILTKEEVRLLLKSPSLTVTGIRDKAILEIMYSTGVRSGELYNLNLTDINLKGNEILIRNTKTRQDRIVPLGQKSKIILEEYLRNSRQEFINGKMEVAVFLGDNTGRRLNQYGLSRIFKRYIKRLGMKKRLTLHCLRHSCATHMLQNGAPLKVIQKILGHEHIKSTEVYTHVLTKDLKVVK